MSKNELVTVEKKEDFNKDTAFFDIVNEHAEKMAKERRIADYERLKKEEAERMSVHKKNTMMNIMNTLKIVFWTISILFFAWVFASWVNVIMNNTDPNGYQFIWSWNFFKMFFGH